MRFSISIVLLSLASVFASFAHASEPVEIIALYKDALSGQDARNRTSNAGQFSLNDLQTLITRYQTGIDAEEKKLSQLETAYLNAKTELFLFIARPEYGTPGFIERYENLVLKEQDAKLRGLSYQLTSPESHLAFGWMKKIIPEGSSMDQYLKAAKPYLKVLARKNRLETQLVEARKEYEKLVRKIIKAADSRDMRRDGSVRGIYRSDLIYYLTQMDWKSWKPVAVVIRTKESEESGKNRPVVIFQPDEKDPVAAVEYAIESANLRFLKKELRNRAQSVLSIRDKTTDGSRKKQRRDRRRI